MKKTTLTLLLISCFSVLIAQPTLTTSNFVPGIGDSQLFYVADTLSVVDPTTGANVTFNYTGINSYGDTRTQYVADPTTTPFSSDFLSATHADTTSGSAINKNYSQTVATDSLNNIGLVADITTYGTVVIQYNQDPEILMKFPFNYGDNYADNYAGVFTIQSNGISTNGNGTATVNADAWGTLMLPFGVSIDSVIRVRTTENLITDTIFIPFPPVTILPVVVSAEYINYYKPSLSKFPLLSFISGSYTQDNNQIDSNRTILCQYPINSLGINDLSKNKIEYSLFPNPTISGTSTLSFDLESNSLIKIDLTNHLGQHVRSVFNGNLQQGNNKVELQTSNLSKGLYFVNVSTNGVLSTKKLLVE